jgi:tetratricopeptide (TPR) repeat protein
MMSRQTLCAAACLALLFTFSSPVSRVRAQDDAAAVLAERAELDKALAAEPESRIPLLERFIAAHPKSLLGDEARERLVRAHATLGEVALKKNDPRRAGEVFRAALQAAGPKISDRLFLQVIWQMPVVMAATGYRFEGIQLMRSFEKRFLDEPQRLTQIGFFYISIESAPDAVRVLERAVELAPEEPRPLTSLGTALIISLRLDDAAAAFSKALELNPRDEYAYLGLANLRRATGNATEAIDLYKKHLEIKPDDANALGGLAVSYLINDDEVASSQALARALVLSPRDFRLYTQLAYLYISRGRIDKAREMNELAMRFEPRFAWSHIVQGNILLAEKKYGEAIAALTQAENYGDFPTLHFELAKAYMVADRYDDALEHLAAAFDITEDGQFETSLGDILNLRTSRLDLLLERERQASLFLNEQPTTPTQYRIAEAMVRINHYLETLPDADKPAGMLDLPVPDVPVLFAMVLGDPFVPADQTPLGPLSSPEKRKEEDGGQDADVSESEAASAEHSTADEGLDARPTPPLAAPVETDVTAQEEVFSTEPSVTPGDAPLVFRRPVAGAVTARRNVSEPLPTPLAEPPMADTASPAEHGTVTSAETASPASGDVAAEPGDAEGRVEAGAESPSMKAVPLEDAAPSAPASEVPAQSVAPVPTEPDGASGAELGGAPSTGAEPGGGGPATTESAAVESAAELALDTAGSTVDSAPEDPAVTSDEVTAPVVDGPAEHRPAGPGVEASESRDGAAADATATPVWEARDEPTSSAPQSGWAADASEPSSEETVGSAAGETTEATAIEGADIAPGESDAADDATYTAAGAESGTTSQAAGDLETEPGASDVAASPGTVEEPASALLPPVEVTEPANVVEAYASEDDGTAPAMSERPSPRLPMPSPPPAVRQLDPATREALLSAIEHFVTIDDGRDAFRKIWVARRLADKGVLLDRAEELANEALAGARAATEPERSVRDMPELDRAARAAVLTARAEDALGWVLVKKGEYQEALMHLARAVEGSAKDADKSNRLWHLGVAKQQAGDEAAALDLFIQSYEPSAEGAPLRRSFIESLYMKLHGSLDGLDRKLARP